MHLVETCPAINRSTPQTNPRFLRKSPVRKGYAGKQSFEFAIFFFSLPLLSILTALSLGWLSTFVDWWFTWNVLHHKHRCAYCWLANFVANFVLRVHHVMHCLAILAAHGDFQANNYASGASVSQYLRYLKSRCVYLSDSKCAPSLQAVQSFSSIDLQTQIVLNI